MGQAKDLIGQTLDNKYRIEKQLGEGGMGAVFLATHLGTDRPVALKIIIPQYMENTEFVERFKLEARAAGRLRHPNVVNVTDFGFTTNKGEAFAYLVMEYLNGFTLGALFKKGEPLSLTFIGDIIEQVCLAIGNAHQQGIVHRDLKPDNIWLEPNGRGSYNIKVLDFGLAKLRTPQASHQSTSTNAANNNTQTMSDNPSGATTLVPASTSQASTLINNKNANNKNISQGVDQSNINSPHINRSSIEHQSEIEQTRTMVAYGRETNQLNETPTISNEALTHAGAILGTPLYMSPEQCLGNDLDERSDIYSLGVIVYQLLTRETPFKGIAGFLMAQHVEVAPPPIDEKRPDLPKPIVNLIMSALAKDPAQRPATAMAFGAALKANADGDIVLLRQAITLFSEHAFLFARVAFLAFTPMTLAIAAFSVGLLLTELQKPLYIIPICLFFYIANLFNNLVSGGLIVPIIHQLQHSPNQPPDLKAILARCRTRLGAFINTSLRNRSHQFYFITTFIPFIIYSALPQNTKQSLMSSHLHWVFIAIIVVMTLAGMSKDYLNGNWLYTPTVIIEGREGNAALMRSRELVTRLGGTLGRSFPLLVFLLINVSLLMLLIIWQTWRFFDHSLTQIDYIFTLSTAFFGVTLSFVLSIIVSPLIAIGYALFYWKARQAGGEEIVGSINNQ